MSKSKEQHQKFSNSMSDEDHAFVYGYDADMASAGREEQERRQMWKQAPANNDDESEEDEVVMNQWTSVVGVMVCCK